MFKKIILIIYSLLNLNSFGQNLPEEFIYLSEIDKSIVKEIRYFSTDNFIGKPINGYEKNVLIISKKAANQLKLIQQELQKDQLSLKIFDAYRPQKAVNHFVKWARVLEDTLKKQEYYPKVPKSELFKRGFIASKSGHTRGSTVDLTIVNKISEKELDMGSPYDFFGEKSHPFTNQISSKQKKNRMLLRNIMMKYNFKPYKNEWWHFTLKNEPFPNTYFNFPVK